MQKKGNPVTFRMIINFSKHFLFNSPLKLFIFVCLLKEIEKSSELKTFRVRKTIVSSKFFIRLRFQGYHCKSGIVIFAWQETQHYAYSAYSPFKSANYRIKLGWAASTHNLVNIIEKLFPLNFIKPEWKYVRRILWRIYQIHFMEESCKKKFQICF